MSVKTFMCNITDVPLLQVSSVGRNGG